MADLGAFGAAIKELDPDREKDTFTYFGEQFEISAALPPILMFKLAAVMTGDLEEVQGMGVMWRAYTAALGEQFDRFFGMAAEMKDSNEDLIKLIMAIYENDAGRPTAQPSVSSDGLSSVSPSSSPSSTVTASAPALGLVDRDNPDDLIPVSRILAG